MMAFVYLVCLKSLQSDLKIIGFYFVSLTKVDKIGEI